MAEYIPPDGINIPFNFTKAGYSAPDDVVFNFLKGGYTASLSAAINVMQPYWEEAYTYPKSCPKYVIGYGPGHVQIIKGRCLYGGIRDLRGFIVGEANVGNLQGIITTHAPVDLPALLGGHLPVDLPAEILPKLRNDLGDLQALLSVHNPSNISAYIAIHIPGNLPAFLEGYPPADLPAEIFPKLHSGFGDLQGVLGVHSPSDINAYIATHLPGNLPASLGAHLPADLFAYLDTHSPGNLGASVVAKYTKVEDNLHASIRAFLKQGLIAKIDTHLPGNIHAYVRTLQRKIIDLSGSIHGWTTTNLGVHTAGGHSPVDLLFSIFAEQPGYSNIGAYIRAWHIGDLRATTNIVYPKNLPAEILIISPENLPAYLNATYFNDIGATLRTWHTSDLGAYIKRTYDKDLIARIVGIPRTLVNLKARIKGYASNNSDIGAYLRALLYENLSAYIYPRYVGDLIAYCRAVPPSNVRGIVHGWQTIDLSAILNGIDYPWNLTASINGVGYWTTLPAYIFALKASNHSYDLRGIFHGWDYRGMPAYIYGANAGILSAYINPYLQAGDLHANINPKMIRLTTIIKIPTLVNRDLSAIINSPCFYTNYSNLLASIYAKYKGDLRAYINAIFFDYKPKDLGAKIGYSDSYLEVDKFNLSIIVLPGKYWEEDKYKIYLNVLRGGNLLGAYIRATLRYKGLGAAVVGESIPSYVYKAALKNREKVIKTTYDGVFKSFEMVEIAFKSIVEDYYYSSGGDYTWKADRFSQWVLDVRSMLPANAALRLGRRLHRATILYDLRKFNSIDEAMKYAISFVTAYPQGNLSASIFNRAEYKVLSATINPRYTRTARGILGSSITPKDVTFVVSNENSVSKV